MKLILVDKSHGEKMMSSILLQSEYADIIIALLNEPYNVDSIIKIVFMAFCIENETNYSYGKRKTDFIDVFLSNLNIKFLSHPKELACIFEVLNKLEKCGVIKSNNGKITKIMSIDSYCCENRFLKGCKEKDVNPIYEINKLDDKAFIEEVLRHV